MIKRVSATETTSDLIKELLAVHGPLLFHQSGGCCDGSAPMCFARDEFRVGSRDVFLGEIADQPFLLQRTNSSTGNTHS